MVEGKGYIGRGTNNSAEYAALIKGLELAWEVGVRGEMEIFSDSQLIVGQMRGTYKVRHPQLLPLHQRARALLKRFKGTRISYIRRGLNREADRLANRALDEALKKAGQPPVGDFPLEESPGPEGQDAG